MVQAETLAAVLVALLAEVLAAVLEVFVPPPVALTVAAALEAFKAWAARAARLTKDLAAPRLEGWRGMVPVAITAQVALAPAAVTARMALAPAATTARAQVMDTAPRWVHMVPAAAVATGHTAAVATGNTAAVAVAYASTMNVEAALLGLRTTFMSNRFPILRGLTVVAAVVVDLAVAAAAAAMAVALAVPLPAMVVAVAAVPALAAAAAAVATAADAAGFKAWVGRAAR